MKWDTGDVARWVGRGLVYNVVQQIDSLNAIVVDQMVGEIITTHDGWKTWQVDSTKRGSLGSVVDVSFANAAEGILRTSNGVFWTTVDSARHWKRETFDAGYSYANASKSYGGGMFRIFLYPDTILTTHNNWRTSDTSYITRGGPLADTSFQEQYFKFGPVNSFAVEGARPDPEAQLHYSTAIALSTDLGATWKEVAIPRHNGLLPGQRSFDWYRVIAGKDSVGRIFQSFDSGTHWETDTVGLSTGVPYFLVTPFAVTGSGRVLAGIMDDSNFMGSSHFAYLEKVTDARSLVVLPDTVDFGTVCRDSLSTASARVGNPDTAQTSWLHVAEWKYKQGDGFSIHTDSVWVAINPSGQSGSSYNLEVNFNRLPDTTTRLGLHRDTLEIPYYAEKSTAFGPVGYVEIPCAATLMGSIQLGSFGRGSRFLDVAVGHKDSVVFAIWNDGQSDADIFALRREKNDTAFTITPPPPLTIAPGRGIRFTLSYLPTRAGVDSELFNFVYHDCSGEEQMYEWPVSGSASVADVAEGAESEDLFRVFPNPATVAINIVASKQTQPIRITDPLGREVLHTTVRDGKLTLDVSSLAPGVYFVLGENARVKLLKE